MFHVQTARDVESFQSIKNLISQHRNILNANEVAVLLYGCSKIEPKDPSILHPLCSRINALYESNFEGSEDKYLNLGHILTILYSLERFSRHNSQFSHDVSTCVTKLIGSFTKSVGEEDIKFDTVSLDKCSRITKTALLIDRMLRLPDLSGSVSRDAKGQIFISISSYLEKCRLILDKNTSDISEENDFISSILPNYLDILFFLSKHNANLDAHRKSLKGLNFGAIKSAKILIKIFLFIVDMNNWKGEEQFDVEGSIAINNVIEQCSNSSVKILLNRIGETGMEDVSYELLLKLLFAMATGNIQHIDIMERISEEFLNRTCHLPKVKDMIKVLSCLSRVSYRNDSLIEICLRHVMNNPSEITPDDATKVLDSCVSQISYIIYWHLTSDGSAVSKHITRWNSAFDTKRSMYNRCMSVEEIYHTLTQLSYGGVSI